MGIFFSRSCKCGGRQTNLRGDIICVRCEHTIHRCVSGLLEKGEQTECSFCFRYLCPYCAGETSKAVKQIVGLKCFHCDGLFHFCEKKTSIGAACRACER